MSNVPGAHRYACAGEGILFTIPRRRRRPGWTASGLPLAAAFAVYEFLDGPLRKDPWRVSRPLRAELEGFRGARRDEYRVVLAMDEERRLIDVVRIDHRANVHR